MYDWRDSYVGGYLREEFKIKPYGDGRFYCSQCLERGVFQVNPLLGFEAADLSISGLEGNPQNAGNGHVYQYTIQWGATGYQWTVTDDGAPYLSGNVAVPVSASTYVGWDGSYNNFKVFPSGNWLGTVPYPPAAGFTTGGSDMVLTPRVVRISAGSAP